ncbi:hypothetical protein MRB53_041761 [Persea americana]|nr:hypothetical protein MRB53_041761 [Persea americana]
MNFVLCRFLLGLPWAVAIIRILPDSRDSFRGPLVYPGPADEPRVIGKPKRFDYVDYWSATKACQLNFQKYFDSEEALIEKRKELRLKHGRLSDEVDSDLIPPDIRATHVSLYAKYAGTLRFTCSIFEPNNDNDPETLPSNRQFKPEQFYDLDDPVAKLGNSILNDKHRGFWLIQCDVGFVPYIAAGPAHDETRKWVRHGQCLPIGISRDTREGITQKYQQYWREAMLKMTGVEIDTSFIGSEPSSMRREEIDQRDSTEESVQPDSDEDIEQPDSDEDMKQPGREEQAYQRRSGASETTHQPRKQALRKNVIVWLGRRFR